MDALLYYLSIPFLYFISVLPFGMLYILSDISYVIIYHVTKYRRKVVLENLQNSFPEKNDEEINVLCKKFYRYFCDLIFETIKLLTISQRALLKHVRFDDTSIFKRYDKQSLIAVMGHYGNWELAGAFFSTTSYHKLYIIYHPLKNKFFDKLVFNTRTRTGNKLYAMNDSLRGMLKDRDKITVTVFVADQTPTPNGAYWTKFLNQDTPVFRGTAKIARKLNYPIIYISMKRPSRGKYTIAGELLAENAARLTEEEISELHIRRLEKDIVEQPEIWLWSHRRWKHKKQQAVRSKQ